ncbi:LysR family transcriptional regulator [Pelagibius sp. Alg239-R121]|uniref:LysR family transcriptional regulator n=1 Tax=Pelagibius sp. Alg239-R121 TaxID=2993448 RepID=UPI0024A64301|nr:LysR family transcriptional regulator [Pelagibius sp. Alg239-R121]
MAPSLKALRYFHTALEHNSISRAAESLNVVPSAVSAAIEQVEQDFGLQLVTRMPSKGIQPTATGKLLLVKVRHLLEEYENLIAEGGDLRTALTGSLNVGYYAPVASAFLPAISARLTKDSNAISLRFHECDNETAQAGLLNGTYDVILFVSEDLKPGIDCAPLITVPPYALVARDHKLAGRKSIAPTDLSEEPLVLLDRPFAGEYYRSIFTQAGLTPRIAATGTTHEMVRGLVGAGVGSAILNMRPMTEVSYAGDLLRCIPLSSEVRPLQLVMGYLPGNPRRLVKAFIGECQQYFASKLAQRLIVTPKSA